MHVFSLIFPQSHITVLLLPLPPHVVELGVVEEEDWICAIGTRWFLSAWYLLLSVWYNGTEASSDLSSHEKRHCHQRSAGYLAVLTIRSGE